MVFLFLASAEEKRRRIAKSSSHPRKWYNDLMVFRVLSLDGVI